MSTFQPPYDKLPAISPSDTIINDEAVRRALLAWQQNPPDPKFDGIQDAGYEENGEGGEEENA